MAAFDVDADKVGIDAGEGDLRRPEQHDPVRRGRPTSASTVQRGPTLDGFGKYYREECEESPAEPVDVAQALRDTRADVLVSYLPVGSEDAQKLLRPGLPRRRRRLRQRHPGVHRLATPSGPQKFDDAGVPIVGDDIKSQVGATIVHRILARLFEDRGMALDRTYQLNFGGNMDFMNMLERKRLESKKISKTQAVTSQIDHGIAADDVHIGPSDHVPWLEDRKWAYIRLEGRNFGDVPLNIELKLEVWDSPNSAGVIIDAVRCAKVALDRGIGGPLLGPVGVLHEERRRCSTTTTRRTRWSRSSSPARGRPSPAPALEASPPDPARRIGAPPSCRAGVRRGPGPTAADCGSPTAEPRPTRAHR